MAAAPFKDVCEPKSMRSRICTFTSDIQHIISKTDPFILVNTGSPEIKGATPSPELKGPHGNEGGEGLFFFFRHSLSAYALILRKAKTES